MIQNLESFNLNLSNPNICGIDEAGRGALAGPLCVAGAILKSPISGLNDSKKLTAKKREQLYEDIIQNSKHEIVFIDNNFIDDNGLTKSIKTAILQIVSKLSTDYYIMDGNHNFGLNYLSTIVKGDSKVPAISAASILAKVSRDRLMSNLNEKYKKYNFDKHKGYGTKSHIESINKYGYSDIHRLSFKLKNQNTLF
jgi:ribonuclease HII